MARKEWADGGGGGNGIKDQRELLTRSLVAADSLNQFGPRQGSFLARNTYILVIGLVNFVLTD